MVKGRGGMYLEAWKFGVYVSIPVIASAYFSNPETLKQQAEYWKFIEYPENPNTNVRQKIQKLVKEKEDQKEQRAEYQRQIQELQRSAQRARARATSLDDDDDVDSSDHSGRRLSWWRRWFGRGDNSTKTQGS